MLWWGYASLLFFSAAAGELKSIFSPAPSQDSEIEAGVFLCVQTPPDLPQLAALRASSHIQHDPLVPELPELCPLCWPGIYISFVPGVPVFSLVNIATTIPPWEHHLASGRLGASLF